MDRYEAARALGVADADVVEVAETENGTEVEVRDGGRRLIRDDGVYALGDHPATRSLRRWPDTETAPAPAAGADGPADADPTAEAASDTPAASEADAESVPDGTAEDVLAWVGDDSDRAVAALEAEEKRDKPRGTLIAKLEKVVG
jgi:hypothetical protein